MKYLFLLTGLLLISCKAETIETKCFVINKGFTASTLKTHTAPIVSSSWFGRDKVEII